jgi:cation-transporting ATPase E
MRVTDTVLLCEDRFSSEDVTLLMTDYAAAHGDDNETMKSLKEYFSGKPKSRATKVMAFSSAFKYSGASFAGGTYFLGAPEKILLSDFESWRGEIDKYASQGFRVLLLAMGDGELDGGPMRPGAFPIALILLTNKIRAEAPAAFRFFAEQGVDIKVISGDSPATVSQIAGEAGIANADKYVDASTLTTQRKILRAVREYTVFGRVTPDQKRKLIRAIKADGHTVAMTGDGVNDVLALKDADCSIAMASGSDVACHVAQLVLLDSNFGAMPSVVMEGRRVINNIERSSSLFLVKNIFSFLLTVIVLGLTLSYPMKPSQLSLFNVMFIGVPSFVLALEPNKSRVRGHFLPNVILTALPAGLTSLFAVLAAVYATDKFALPQEQLGALSTILISFVGLMTLIRVSLPLNSLRRVLVIAMVAGFVTGSLVLRDLFSMADFSWRAAGFAAIIAVICVPVMFILTYVVNMFRRRKKPRKVVVADDYGE